jgi:predicted ArsR family transcriptional regulator
MGDPIAELFQQAATAAKWEQMMRELEAEGLVEVVAYRRGQPAYRITEKGRQQFEQETE